MTFEAEATEAGNLLTARNEIGGDDGNWFERHYWTGEVLRIERIGCFHTEP